MTSIAWCTCVDCDGQAELALPEYGGLQVGCPDCGGPMTEDWRWDDRPRHGGRWNDGQGDHRQGADRSRDAA